MSDTLLFVFCVVGAIHVTGDVLTLLFFLYEVFVGWRDNIGLKGINDNSGA